jgi:hypothetical protein
MTPKLSTVALWVGIVGSAAAVYFPMRQEVRDEHQAEVDRAVKHENDMNAIWTFVKNDHELINAMGTQMPKNTKVILDAISKAQEQARAQETAQMQKGKATHPQTFSMEILKGTTPKEPILAEEPVVADAPATQTGCCADCDSPNVPRCDEPAMQAARTRAAKKSPPPEKPE